MPDNLPAQSACVHPDRASTWFFSGQMPLPQTFCDNMDAMIAINEIPASIISDAFNSFSAYQASRMSQLKIFSFSFDSDRSTLQPGSLLNFTGFVTAEPQVTFRYGTVRDWMPDLILNSTHSDTTTQPTFGSNFGSDGNSAIMPSIIAEIRRA